MTPNSDFINCKGCVALGEYEGEEVCYNLVRWIPPKVPKNPPCMTTKEDEEMPEYIAHIESWRVILRMMMGGSK